MTEFSIDRLEVGAVIQRGSGPHRIVRAVSRKAGLVTFVSLAIRHCSWTKRCYTVVDRYALKEFRRVPVPLRRLRSKLDQQILREIRRGADPARLTCCDVRGVA